MAALECFVVGFLRGCCRADTINEEAAILNSTIMCFRRLRQKKSIFEGYGAATKTGLGPVCCWVLALEFCVVGFLYGCCRAEPINEAAAILNSTMMGFCRLQEKKSIYEGHRGPKKTGLGPACC